MKILVCIKQVPDMESKFKISADSIWYDRSDLAWRMNEYDEYGVEQAVKVKEQTGADITVLSIGPEKVKETMKKALAMGCDRGVHIVDDQSHLRDPYEIASMIAVFARYKDFDLIFTGMQSQDRASAQVGVMVAELLAIPAVTTIVDFALVDGKVTVKRELEGGIKAKVETGLPLLVTCQLGLNTPRYPTLPNIMKAKKKEMLSFVAGDLHEADTLQETVKVEFPVKRSGGLFLEGEVADIADRLIEILKEQTAILA